MALDAPFYLAIGDCVIEDGTGDLDYQVAGKPGMWFPEPDPDGSGGHLSATRTVTVRVLGTGTADISANIAALRREAVRGNLLRFRPGTVGDILECRIVDAKIVEENYDPLRRSISADLSTVLTVTLVTDPYWLGAWTADTSPTVTGVPGHFDVSSPTGEVDALMRLRCLPVRNGTILAIGVKPEPGASYGYLDDYSGTSDANGVGGAKATLAANSTLAAVGTAPDIDTNDNRGRHLMLARMDSSGTTAANSTAKGRVVTTGNLISSSTTVDEQVQTFSVATDLAPIEMGDVVIPAGQVPDVSAGSGHAAEAIEASNTTAASLTTAGTYHSQSFPVANPCKHTGVTLKVKNTSGSAQTLTVRLYAADGSYKPVDAAGALATVNVSVPNGTDGEVRATWDADIAAGTYCVAASGTGIQLYYSTASSYATHKMGTNTGKYTWTVSTTDDLYFKSHTRTRLGFVTTNPVLAACTESSKTIGLDYVQRIPVDYAAMVYRRTSGSLGFYYDGDTDTPYIADADGIGPTILASCEIRKPLRLRPGVTNRVVLGIGQGDETVQGFTALTYSYRPRFLTATG